MIATLSGTVAEKFDGLVVVEAMGVGFGLFVNPDDHGKLKLGAKTKLYIHEHIRENSHDLYGFSLLADKHLFEQLLEVNGVGPKMALAVLSVGTTDEVRQAIASADTRFLQTAPGVGKRVAERVVVDLKDKVGLASADNIDKLLTSTSTAQKDDAAQALMALGFTAADAVESLQAVPKDLPTEQRIKEALKTGSR